MNLNKIEIQAMSREDLEKYAIGILAMLLHPSDYGKNMAHAYMDRMKSTTPREIEFAFRRLTSGMSEAEAN